MSAFKQTFFLEILFAPKPFQVNHANIKKRKHAKKKEKLNVKCGETI